MPMPHRTFAQVAKRRLVGKEGRERIREVRALLAELPDYRNGPYADLRKCAARGDRGHPRPLERRPSRLDRGPPRGRRPGRAGRPAQRRQVVPAAGALGDPDQDRRLRVHHAPTGAGAHPHPRGARPARRDPRADRRSDRGSWWRPGPARRAPVGRRDRVLRRADGDPADLRVVRDEVAAAGIEKPAIARRHPRRRCADRVRSSGWPAPSRSCGRSPYRCSTRRRLMRSGTPSGRSPA